MAYLTEKTLRDGVEAAHRPLRILLVLLLLISTLVACGGDEQTQDPSGVVLEPPAAGTGYQLSFEAVAPPAKETWLCQIGLFPAQETTNIGSVISRQTEGVHHMDIMAIAFTGLSLPPGMYECEELYRDNPMLMENGIFLYAAQAAEQSLTLPPGTAAQIPKGLTVMYEMHFVNATSEPINIKSLVNVYLRDDAEVKQTIWGNAVRDTHMVIPPASEHTEWTRCVMSEDIDLLFLSSHTHELATAVRVSLFDGSEVAPDIMYENYDWATPYLEDYTPKPLRIKKGTGFHFECDFNNHRDEEVNWGFAAEDEMCQIALVYTPGDPGITCDVVDSSDGVID